MRAHEYETEDGHFPVVLTHEDALGWQGYCEACGEDVAGSYLPGDVPASA